MSDRINVEEILRKHSINFEVLKKVANRDGKGGTEYDRLQAAIKEIVEAVVNRVEEGVRLKVFKYNHKSGKVDDCSESDGDVYWESHPEDQPYPDLQVQIDKDSILQVKQLIDYGNDS